MDTHVLLVEDEDHLARGLCFNLEACGYRVHVFERGETALEFIEQGDDPADLIVLDVMLPGISGFDVLERLRAADNPVSVLLLTARDTEEDIVTGLDMGADDYLTKPFSLPVLMARVRTLLRRSDGRSEVGSFSIGECTVFPDRFETELNGNVSSLTAKELGLLLLLYSRRGSAVSRGDILQDVWGLHPDTRTRVVDTFVLRLRKLIEPNPSSPQFLHSVRSFGYKLNVD